MQAYIASPETEARGGATQHSVEQPEPRPVVVMLFERPAWQQSRKFGSAPLLSALICAAEKVSVRQESAKQCQTSTHLSRSSSCSELDTLTAGRLCSSSHSSEDMGLSGTLWASPKEGRVEATSAESHAEGGTWQAAQAVRARLMMDQLKMSQKGLIN